jgi:class 3 adenylate cyclase/HAMP domain-containing protein
LNAQRSPRLAKRRASRDPPHHHLRVKVTALIVGILASGFGGLVLLNVRQEARALVASHRAAARLLAGSIVASIENGMLEGRPDIIRRLISELRGQLTEVRRLDVYRPNGVEAFADLDTVTRVTRRGGLDPGVAARIAAMRREPGAQIDHPLFTQAVNSVATQETLESAGDGHLLTLFWPLRNVEACQGCHGRDHQVRGVVRISLGLERLDAELRAARTRQVAVAIATIVAITAALVVFMGRVVVRPIAAMAEVARRIGSGDFHARVIVASDDEIGELGRVLNEMTSSLKTARDDLEARNVELTAALEHLTASMRKVELLEQIKSHLVKFVPGAVTRLLEKDPDARELEKREADVSVLFLDVEGYTRLAESLRPLELDEMIQAYFSRFFEVIREHDGDINETAGDGLMVVFQSEGSATAHALNAAGAAFQLLERASELNQEFEGVYPSVAIHVGINSGQGLVGATKLDVPGGARWTFTASGPTTNLAARIAGMTRGGEILVGPETARRIQDHYILEDRGVHQLKNVSGPVRLFRLVPTGIDWTAMPAPTPPPA